MVNERKIKQVLFDVTPGKTPCYIDDMTGEITKVEIKERITNKKLARMEKKFMKLYTQNGILAKIQQVAGSDSQYLLTLSCCIIDDDNLVHMGKFENDVGISKTSFYALLRRLKDKGIMGKLGKNWYVNPYFLGYSNFISTPVVKLFQEKTATLYGITEI